MKQVLRGRTLTHAEHSLFVKVVISLFSTSLRLFHHSRFGPLSSYLRCWSCFPHFVSATTQTVQEHGANTATFTTLHKLITRYSVKDLQHYYETHVLDPSAASSGAAVNRRNADDGGEGAGEEDADAGPGGEAPDASALGALTGNGGGAGEEEEEGTRGRRSVRGMPSCCLVVFCPVWKQLLMI